MKRLALPALLAIALLAATSCTTAGGQFGAAGGDVICGQGGVEAGQDDDDVTSIGEVGVMAVTSAYDDWGCGGGSVHSINVTRVAMIVGYYDHGEWVQYQCGEQVTSTGGTPGDPHGSVAGFRYADIPNPKPVGCTGLFDQVGISIGASSHHVGLLHGVYFEETYWSGWEVCAFCAWT